MLHVSAGGVRTYCKIPRYIYDRTEYEVQVSVPFVPCRTESQIRATACFSCPYSG